MKEYWTFKWEKASKKEDPFKSVTNRPHYTSLRFAMLAFNSAQPATSHRGLIFLSFKNFHT